MGISMADKKVRRQIRLSGVAWRQLDLIAEAVGTSSSGEAVSFLIRQKPCKLAQQKISSRSWRRV
jgi:hypothetical protein